MKNKMKFLLVLITFGVISACGNPSEPHVDDGYLVQGLRYQTLDQYLDRFGIDKESIDEASFTILSDGLAYDNNTIYSGINQYDNSGNPALINEYQQKLLDYLYQQYPTLQKENIDKESFQYLSLSLGLARDKNRAFANGKVLKNSNPQYIQSITPYIYTDGYAIYNIDELLSQDVKNFEKLEGIYLKDSQYIYYIDPRSFKNEVLILENADARYFEVFNKRFAKDDRNIFISAQQIPNVDIESVQFFDNYFIDKNRGYFIPNNTDNRIQIINDIENSSFMDLGNQYAKDKNFVYHRGKRLQGADAQTFEMNQYGVFFDKNGVYYDKYLVIGADTASFKKIANTPYSMDKNSVYFAGVPILGADVKSFRVLEKNAMGIYEYSADKNYLYKGYFSVKDFSVEGLEELGDGWFKNPEQVVYKTMILPGLKGDSFKRVNANIVRDDHAVYYVSQDSKSFPLTSVEDPKTFKHIKFNYYADQSAIYYFARDMIKLDADANSFSIKPKANEEDSYFESDYIIQDAISCFEKMERVQC